MLIAQARVGGDVSVWNSSGKVSVIGCGGETYIKNSFAKTQVFDNKGPLKIESESGEVDVKNISGETSIKTSFKKVTFASIAGKLMIRAESCDVEGKEVTGDCKIRSSFKSISVSRVKGNLTVMGESSAVELAEIASVPENAIYRIHTSFKPITLQLPPGVKPVISAYTEFGKIESDVPIRYKIRKGKPIASGNINIKQ